MKLKQPTTSLNWGSPWCTCTCPCNAFKLCYCALPDVCSANSLWDFQMEESSPNYSWCSHLISLSLFLHLSLILSLPRPPSFSLTLSLHRGQEAAMNNLELYRWMSGFSNMELFRELFSKAQVLLFTATRHLSFTYMWQTLYTNSHLYTLTCTHKHTVHRTPARVSNTCKWYWYQMFG